MTGLSVEGITFNDFYHPADLAALMGFWTVWLINLRLFVAIFAFLRPMVLAFMREAVLRLDGQHVNPLIVDGVVQRTYISFMRKVLSTTGVVLLLGGIATRAVGEIMTITGDVIVLVARTPQRWDHLDRWMDATSALPMVLGATLISAALAEKRIVSLWVSVGFFLTGVGIALVTATF